MKPAAPVTRIGLLDVNANSQRCSQTIQAIENLRLLWRASNRFNATSSSAVAAVKVRSKVRSADLPRRKRARLDGLGHPKDVRIAKDAARDGGVHRYPGSEE